MMSAKWQQNNFYHMTLLEISIQATVCISTEESRIPGGYTPGWSTEIRKDAWGRLEKTDSHYPYVSSSMPGQTSAEKPPPCRRRLVMWTNFTMDPRAGHLSASHIPQYWPTPINQMGIWKSPGQADYCPPSSFDLLRH